MSDLFSDLMSRMASSVAPDHAAAIDARLSTASPQTIDLIHWSVSFAAEAVAANDQRYMDIAMAFLAASGVLAEMFFDASSVLVASDSMWASTSSIVSDQMDPSHFDF